MDIFPKKFPREDDFDNLIDKWCNKYTLDFYLVKGLVGVESNFAPNSYLVEPSLPKTNGFTDGSYGLTQILLSTAKGLGFTNGTQTAKLFDPDINLEYGLKFLAMALSKYDSADKGIAAYNMGHPHPAFGECPYHCKLGPGQTVKQAAIYGKAAPDWVFANQPYVNRVKAYALFYRYKKEGKFEQCKKVFDFIQCKPGKLVEALAVV